MSFRRAKLEYNVLPFQIAKFTQPFVEFFFERLRVCGPNVERAYPSHLGLLRAHRERPGRRSATDNTEKFPPPHVRPQAQDEAS